MRLTLWLAAAAVVLGPLAPVGQQQKQGLSVEQVQELVNAHRPGELDDLEKADPGSGLAAITAMDALLNQHRPQLVDTLRGLTPSHFQKDIAFLSQVLLGSVWKVRNGDADDLRVASLPESQELYWVQYSLNILLLFQWSGSTLRLVNMIGIGV